VAAAVGLAQVSDGQAGVVTQGVEGLRVSASEASRHACRRLPIRASEAPETASTPECHTPAGA